MQCCALHTGECPQTPSTCVPVTDHWFKTLSSFFYRTMELTLYTCKKGMSEKLRALDMHLHINLRMTGLT